MILVTKLNVIDSFTKYIFWALHMILLNPQNQPRIEVWLCLLLDRKISLETLLVHYVANSKIMWSINELDVSHKAGWKPVSREIMWKTLLSQKYNESEKIPEQKLTLLNFPIIRVKLHPENS